MGDRLERVSDDFVEDELCVSLLINFAHDRTACGQLNMKMNVK